MSALRCPSEACGSGGVAHRKVPGPEAVYYVAQKLKTRFFIINRAGDEFLCLVSRPENLPNFSGQTLISGNLAKIRFCFSGHIINSLRLSLSRLFF